MSEQQSRNPKVDAFLKSENKWRDEFTKLRAILLRCEVVEELKWGKPCYTFQGANVAIIHGFKEYCALLFCKGVLLKDQDGILIQQTENVQAARQLRFTNVQQIIAQEAVVKAYVDEAVEIERAGLKVTYKTNAELVLPEEFQRKLDADRKLKAAFAALTPGRQRAYNLYFTGAKQSKTREARVEKCVPRILEGKGMDDE